MSERYRIRDYIQDHEIEITLDGSPATIGGYQMSFGTVGILSHGRSEEFSWQAIERVVRLGGKFKS
jgi:hypothetical protein